MNNLRLHVRFLVNDGNSFHIGGFPGVDFLGYFDNSGVDSKSALNLYRNNYQYPPVINTPFTDTVGNLLLIAEDTVGIVPANNSRKSSLCELVMGIESDIYRFTDSGMKLQKLLKYFSADSIHTVYLCVKSIAGEVLLENKGLRFFIHPAEHGPHNIPHVHVTTPNREFESSLCITDGAVLGKSTKRGLPNKKLTEAKKSSPRTELNSMMNGFVR